ncbi:DUF2750 domain-containing protein [Flocculibacter collagenilyticus]|uniref:DUF2750 domain-containing protein n=1 Tax=Flocculibacter collagenilyticus TaxID=2744479 RepID=UPI0018F6A699|nr:DUF2750 domain-containing protein [Flocculibacter collagenilyticus]
MSDAQLTDKQVEVINNMSDETRYEYIVSQAKQHQKIWTLSDEKGCLLINTGEEQCLAIFSHKQLATTWAAIDHPECTPLEIELSAFLNAWVVGMENDGFQLAIQPNVAGESLIATPSEFASNFGI